MSTNDMKPEYDFSHFSQGERGKFSRPGARVNLPVYLQQSVRETLSAIADSKGITLDDLVNELLKKELEIAKTLR